MITVNSTTALFCSSHRSITWTSPHSFINNKYSFTFSLTFQRKIQITPTSTNISDVETSHARKWNSKIVWHARINKLECRGFHWLRLHCREWFMDHVIFGCLGALLFSPVLYTCANVLFSSTVHVCKCSFLVQLSSPVNVPHRLARWLSTGACKCHVVRCCTWLVMLNVTWYLVLNVTWQVSCVKCHRHAQYAYHSRSSWFPRPVRVRRHGLHGWVVLNWFTPAREHAELRILTQLGCWSVSAAVRNNHWGHCLGWMTSLTSRSMQVKRRWSDSRDTSLDAFLLSTVPFPTLTSELTSTQKLSDCVGNSEPSSCHCLATHTASVWSSVVPCVLIHLHTEVMHAPQTFVELVDFCRVEEYWFVNVCPRETRGNKSIVVVSSSS